VSKSFSRMHAMDATSVNPPSSVLMDVFNLQANLG